MYVGLRVLQNAITIDTKGSLCHNAMVMMMPSSEGFFSEIGTRIKNVRTKLAVWVGFEFCKPAENEK